MSSRYDLLPEDLFFPGCKILDIGAGDGKSQLESKHQVWFTQSNYLGLEIRSLDIRLNIIKADVMEYQTKERYDLVLALAVIEHIPFSHWPLLFSKMKGWLNNGGSLVVLVPYNESLDSYITSRDYELSLSIGAPCHVVHGITPKVLRHFLSGAKMTEIKHPVLFRNDGESFLWASARFVKRLLTGHEYVWKGLLRRKLHLITTWKKREVPSTEAGVSS